MTVELLAPATVLRLRGLGAPLHYMDGWCNGLFDREPYTPFDVDYPASLSRASLATGVRLFDKLVRTTAGNIIGLGHSQGCQVLTDWMEKYADDPTAPDGNRLQFVLTGNLLRNPTGKGIGAPIVDGSTGTATPTTLRWPILDVARKRDGWAIKDCPMAFLGRLFVHPKYKGVDLTEEPLQSLQVGSTHSVVVR